MTTYIVKVFQEVKQKIIYCQLLNNIQRIINFSVKISYKEISENNNSQKKQGIEKL